jgi:hypothetical protein
MGAGLRAEEITHQAWKVHIEIACQVVFSRVPGSIENPILLSFY